MICSANTARGESKTPISRNRGEIGGKAREHIPRELIERDSKNGFYLGRRFDRRKWRDVPILETRTHNPKVVGSNPAPATKIKSLTCENGQGFFIAGEFSGRKRLPRGPFLDHLEGVRKPSGSRFPGPFYLSGGQYRGGIRGEFSRYFTGNTVLHGTRGGIGIPTRVAAAGRCMSEKSPHSPLPASSRNRLRCDRGGPVHPPRGAIEDVGSMVNEHREL